MYIGWVVGGVFFFYFVFLSLHSLKLCDCVSFCIHVSRKILNTHTHTQTIVITNYLVDDTISIFEPPVKNSVHLALAPSQSFSHITATAMHSHCLTFALTHPLYLTQAHPHCLTQGMLSGKFLERSSIYKKGVCLGRGEKYTWKDFEYW